MSTNYETLNAKLGSRESRKLANNTYAKRRGDHIAIMLHATDILKYWPDGRIEVQTGGWKSSTTKARINDYAPMSLFQRKGQWFWRNGMPFTDGDTFNAAGELQAQATPEATKAESDLRKRILRYSKLFASALPLPAPGAGDCFYCAMREVETGKPLGECNHDTSHLESHMEESYLVPSLAYRAMEQAGAGQAYMAGVFQADASFLRDLAKRNLPRWIAKYMYRQFGLVA